MLLLQQTNKFQRINSPTSKPTFLSYLLKINSDHQSAGLRWLPLLNGGGFRWYYTSYSLIFLCCHVFLKTYLLHSLLLQQMNMTCLPYLMVNWISQLIIVEDQSWKTMRFVVGEDTQQCLECCTRWREKEPHVCEFDVC